MRIKNKGKSNRMLKPVFLLLVILACYPGFGQNKKSPNPGKEIITIDFSKVKGKIKNLNGVNNGPFRYGPQSAPIEVYHAEAEFPFTRLHDVNWPNSEAIDIHAIFPIFDADADDPKNYIFKKSDDYITAIIKNKSEIIYRLGESIEHTTTYFIHPPLDFSKWAKICVNIIRHYNEGWNNGFHYNIKYWEIWNEPDGKNMWLGSAQQYFELYKTTVKAIKEYNPLLKVGGPAATGIKSKIIEPFLYYCRDQSLPLDFLSWHAYPKHPGTIVKDAKDARKILDEFGFTKTESFLDEWHFRNISWEKLFPGNDGNDSNLEKYKNVRADFEEINGPKAAVFAAAVLMLLQDCPVDVATYYSADYNNPFSMFDIYGIPGKVYYVFKAFNQVLKTPNRIVTDKSKEDSTGKHVVILAGVSDDASTGAILISNSLKDDKSAEILLKSLSSSRKWSADIYLIDKSNNLDLIKNSKVDPKHPVINLQMAPVSVYLIKLSGE